VRCGAGCHVQTADCASQEPQPLAVGTGPGHRACLGPRFLRRRQRNAENPAKHHVTDALIPIAAAAGCSYFNWNAAYSGSEGICASLHRDFAYRAAGGHGNKQAREAKVRGIFLTRKAKSLPPNKTLGQSCKPYLLID